MCKENENSCNLLPVNSSRLSETHFGHFVTYVFESWHHLKVGFLRFFNERKSFQKDIFLLKTIVF